MHACPPARLLLFDLSTWLVHAHVRNEIEHWTSNIINIKKSSLIFYWYRKMTYLPTLFGVYQKQHEGKHDDLSLLFPYQTTYYRIYVL